MRLLDLPSLQHQTNHLSNLNGASAALAICQIAAQNQHLNLVITPDNHSALQLSSEIAFFAPSLKILTLPDWETLPYDYFSPHQDITSERLKALYQLPNQKNGVLIVPITTAMQRLAPQEFIAGASLILEIGQSLDLAKMRLNLEAAGYRSVATVYAHGEFALRGSVFDIFPMGLNEPLRIDLFDNEIETLRIFDAETQRSISKIDFVNLLPAREFAFDQNAIDLFRRNFRERFNVNFNNCPIYQDVSNGIASGGIEYYLPLFFNQTATLFDYLPSNSQILSLGQIHESATKFMAQIKDRYEQRGVDSFRPLLPPNDLFLSVEECFRQLKNYAHIYLNSDQANAIKINAQQLPDVSMSTSGGDLANLRRFTENFNGKILFCAESAGRSEALTDLLTRIKIKPQHVNNWQEFLSSEAQFNLAIAPMAQDLLLQDYALISESSLLGQKVMQRRKKGARLAADNLIKNLAELIEGAPVVHIEHGIGRYLGLVTMEYDDQTAEFIALEYADAAKLYVPVTNLHLIGRYLGADGDNAPLHKLGSDKWSKDKRKAAEQVRDVAAELLDIHARRAARKGFAFSDPKADYLTFSNAFAFVETPDQAAAIEAVRSDMLSDKAMDRLICGDVGFGKTEVAMRAAFIAVHSGKQVAILVPTTLLAEQHFHSFKDRFADWPVNIEVVSRFKSAKEVKQVLANLEQGKVDILIGTHKLLQSSVKFSNLGLLIIDEEHRFGVRQKEQLKSLRSEVDILTLTATPIPRTLNMAMSGMRDLSIIATPPARRLAVKTFVTKSDSLLIKDAILRELQRGGQVYYLHNDVKSIQNCAEKLAKLVPEARIAIGHGQMNERELERIMSDFYHQKFNVLIASTIIETGIDVPSANTIIIERADKFGLAQLHQLRGRVGRSHHQAYAYLLIPSEQKLSSDARKRLDAITLAEDLGAGFVLATHDLEIRGAGELLGEGQSGQIHAIGFSLYMEMLEQAVKTLKNGQKINLDQPLNFGAEVNLHAPCLIPNDYLPDVHARLILYKRIASTNLEELRELQVEMIDRFGLLPDATKNLMALTKLKIAANELGLSKIDLGTKGGKIEFNNQTKIDLSNLIRLMQQKPQNYQLSSANCLKLRLDLLLS